MNRASSVLYAATVIAKIETLDNMINAMTDLVNSRGDVPKIVVGDWAVDMKSPKEWQSALVMLTHMAATAREELANLGVDYDR